MLTFVSVGGVAIDVGSVEAGVVIWRTNAVTRDAPYVLSFH